MPDYQLTLTQVQGQRGLPVRTVSEAGLYSMVMRSDKPEAQAFRDWVTGTVLPAIRKDGGYIKDEEKVATGDMSEDELANRKMPSDMPSGRPKKIPPHKCETPG